jgi:integrase
MAVVQNFQAFMNGGGLICPAGKSKIEWAVADEPGLFVECRVSAKAIPTWYLRQKNSTGTNTYSRLGTVKELSLAQARKLAQQIKSEAASVPPKTGKANAAPKATPTEMTLERFFWDLALPQVRAHKRASSVVKDLSLFEKAKNGLSGKFGHLPLSAIRRRDVEIFQNAMLAEGLSPSTVRHHTVLLSRLLNLAVGWELLERNPLRGIGHVAVSNWRTIYMTPEQTRRLVEVLSTDENRPVCSIILFLLNSGCRKMEAIKCQWSDIDFDNKQWTIPPAHSKSKRRQTLPISEVTLQLLNDLPSKGKSIYVFPNPATGLPFVTISRVWYRLRAKAGLSPAMHLHDLRACLAERLLSGGASLYLVQRLLTHQDSRTTQAYARLAPKALFEGINLASVPMPQPQSQPLPDAANMATVAVPLTQTQAA